MKTLQLITLLFAGLLASCSHSRQTTANPYIFEYKFNLYAQPSSKAIETYADSITILRVLANDYNNQPASFITVKVKNQDTKDSIIGSTDSDGMFNQQLPAGRYMVSYSSFYSNVEPDSLILSWASLTTINLKVGNGISNELTIYHLDCQRRLTSNELQSIRDSLSAGKRYHPLLDRTPEGKFKPKYTCLVSMEI